MARPEKNRNKILANFQDRDKAGFEEFLTQFKTTAEEAVTNALGGMNIDEDDLSDYEDLMEHDGDRGRAKPAPHHKYKNLLQKLANRTETEAVIELDDLESV